MTATVKTGAAHPEQVLRLKKIEGQIRGVQKMLEERRYCLDVLRQLSAIDGAIRKVEQNILKRHLESCFTAAFRSDDTAAQQEKIAEVITLLENSYR